MLPAHQLISTAHAATHTDAGGDGWRVWLLLILAAGIYGVAYRISIRRHPYRNCRHCHGTGKHRGAIFTRSFRACDHCRGTGRQLRVFAKE